MFLFAFVTALGGLITLIFIAKGIRTLATSSGLDAGLVLVLIGGLFLTIMWLWAANVRLLIGREEVGYRNIFRRSRFWSRGEVGRIVDMAISYRWPAHPPQRALYFFEPNGH